MIFGQTSMKNVVGKQNI